MPPKGALAEIGSTKWLATTAKSFGPFWTAVILSIVGFWYCVVTVSVWAGEKLIQPAFEDWRANNKQIVATHAETIGIVKVFQQELSKRDAETSRVANELEKSNARSEVRDTRIEQGLLQLSENVKRMGDELRANRKAPE